VVIHHTAEKSFEKALQLLQTHNSGGPVSAHYLIGRDGRLGQLVSEDERAWHAGSGTWGPYRDMNSLSIGIELDNTGFEPFPDAQIEKLLVLLEDVTKRYGIPRMNVVGHADVEPVLKTDPSAWFPWQRLAEKGFGLWPDADLAPGPGGLRSMGGPGLHRPQPQGQGRHRAGLPPPPTGPRRGVPWTRGTSGFSRTSGPGSWPSG